MYKTIPIKAKFTDEEKAFWVDQCEHSNSLYNSAIYLARQNHYAMLLEYWLIQLTGVEMNLEVVGKLTV